jgi:diacylglycerol kinase (ATP)
MTSVGVLAHAGKTMGGGLGELRKTLAAYGINDPLWREVPKSKRVPRAARDLVQAGADLIYVWGGDGTIQRCIDTVAGEPVTLAIIPAGTANLFANNLGIPDDLEAAVGLGLHGDRRTLDVGKVNGERFAVMAGTGLDAIMIRDADAGLKDRLGRIAYVWTGAKSVGRDPVRATIDVDGKRWFDGNASCVLVGNMGDVIGGIAAFPDARPDDGVLEIGVVTADGALDWLRTLGRSVVGDVVKSPFVDTSVGTAFDVRLGSSLPYELDGGDRKGSKRLKFKIQPGAIAVCVPERKDEG